MIGPILGLTAGFVLAGVGYLFVGMPGMAGVIGHDPEPDGHGHGAIAHDEANTPGLQGANTTPEESAELAVLFRSFETLIREVTNLPGGIRTVTRSSDPYHGDIDPPCDRHDRPR